MWPWIFGNVPSVRGGVPGESAAGHLPPRRRRSAGEWSDGTRRADEFRSPGAGHCGLTVRCVTVWGHARKPPALRVPRARSIRKIPCGFQTVTGPESRRANAEQPPASAPGFNCDGLLRRGIHVLSLREKGVRRYALRILPLGYLSRHQRGARFVRFIWDRIRPIPLVVNSLHVETTVIHFRACVKNRKYRFWGRDEGAK